MITDATERAEALSARLFESMIGAMDLATVHLGDRLGLYAALSEGGPATPAELADRTGTDERYVREWLEQQAVTGILGEDEGVFSLPPGHDIALLEQEHLAYGAALARMTIGMLSPLDALLQAFRTGEGVPYSAYGEHAHEGIAAGNRPLFTNQLASEWMPALPDVDRRLRAEPGAHIADLGCGHGWSTIALARAYPDARVDGFDSDVASIARARAHAEQAGVADRVRFFVQDASDPGFSGRYALVTIFEALHDMAHPVQALETARRLLDERGAVLVGDERAEEAFSAPGDELQRLFYGASVLHCLAVGRCEHGSAATGTVMRPSTLEAYARTAGFDGIEVLPIEHVFWRFYRL
jgi:ubiquinone/menaquinone biosynthesis C-methylase UbiE